MSENEIEGTTKECLLAVLAAFLSSDEVPALVAQTLEAHLGVGWAREYAGARSPRERADCIVRRLRLHKPVPSLQTV